MSAMPELVNLNDEDSNASFTNFVNRIPTSDLDDYGSFEQNSPLREIIKSMMQKPSKVSDLQLNMNDQGYDNVSQFKSVLGVEFALTEDYQEQLKSQAEIVYNRHFSSFPKEKESQNITVLNIQINQNQDIKKRLQQEIIALQIQRTSLHKEDVRQSLISELLLNKEQEIKHIVQLTNLMEDHITRRQIIEKQAKLIKDTFYQVLKLEVNLTSRTHKHIIELQLSSQERELILSQQIQRQKQIIAQKDQQIQEIQQQIQFTFDHYNKLEQQIEIAKALVQRQVFDLRKPQEETRKQSATISQIRMPSSSFTTEQLPSSKSPIQRKSMVQSQFIRGKMKTSTYVPLKR